jgi:hypothetical protein
MDAPIAIALIGIAVIALVSGMAYYTIARSRDNSILAESQTAISKGREFSDDVRNLVTGGQQSATMSYQYSFGYVTLLDDGTTVVKATIDGQPRNLVAVPHSKFAYVGKYSIFSTIPLYPLGVGDGAIATNTTYFTPIYYYSQQGYSYVITNDRVYLQQTQTQINEQLIQIYVITYTEASSGPPTGTVTLLPQTSTRTFTYNVYSSISITATSGNDPLNPANTLTQTWQPSSSVVGTVRIELTQVNIQLSYAKS